MEGWDIEAPQANILENHWKEDSGDDSKFDEILNIYIFNVQFIKISLFNTENCRIKIQTFLNTKYYS